MTYDVVILGGGISGLSAAYALERTHPGLSALLIEEKSRLGGWMQTVTLPSGQRYEAGPRSLLLRGKDAIATDDLIRSVGLGNEVLFANRQSNARYVIINGVPTQLPMGFVDLIRTPTGRQLARKIFCEPFLHRGTAEDESVASFFARRAPSPLVDKLANALVSGIWGGDPTQLSICRTLPELKEAEQKYGSCLVGALASMFQKKERPQIRGLCSFKNGLESLVTAIRSRLRMPIVLQTPVHSIDPSSDPILITTSTGSVRARKVIIALSELSGRRLAPSLYGTAAPVPHASFATVVMGWETDCLERRGFGMLAPSTEDPHVLGVVLDSCVFPEQNTQMPTRMTVILGGARWPAVAEQSDETLLRIASSRVAAWTGVGRPCTESAVLRSIAAMPQPIVGSRPLCPYLASPCQRLFAIGPAIGGVAVKHCISSGYRVAADISPSLQAPH
jgi:oxygen-dependent protoporphyrinogen oxidase